VYVFALPWPLCDLALGCWFLDLARGTATQFAPVHNLALRTCGLKVVACFTCLRGSGNTVVSYDFIHFLILGPPIRCAQYTGKMTDKGDDQRLDKLEVSVNPRLSPNPRALISVTTPPLETCATESAQHAHAKGRVTTRSVGAAASPSLLVTIVMQVSDRRQT